MIEEHSRHFYMGVPQALKEELRREVIVAQGYHRVYLCGEQKKGMDREKGRGL